MGDLDDMDELTAPNCPDDLIPMDAEEVGGHVRWTCKECGLVRL